MTVNDDRPLVLVCPDCKAMMWAGSSKCARCRAVGGEPDTDRPADKTRTNDPTKPKSRRN